MVMGHSDDGVGDDAESWEPLAQFDYVLLVVASLHQVLVIGVVVHVLWCRSWPPYVVKNVSLVCVTGIAGVVNMVGVVMSTGFLEYKRQSILSSCFLHGFLTWTGSGLYYAAAVVRVYRNYRVLIHHNADMLRPVVQILVVQTPIWLMTFALFSPAVARMDLDTNKCDGEARHVMLAAFNYAGALLLGATCLLWKMRNVRKQMNEYRVMMMSLGFLIVSVVILDATAGCYSSDATMSRRVALLNNFIRSAILFWPIIFFPLLKYAVRDYGYAERFAMSKTRALTPRTLRASLAEQLKVDEFWEHFREIAQEKNVDPVFPSFYKEVMDREKEGGYLERQAKTMDIIDTYVADSAPSWLEISDGCRARILASEVTRDDIFEEAASEVLAAMREKCEEAFRASGVYAQLLSITEGEIADADATKKVKVVVSATGAGSTGSGSSASRISGRWWTSRRNISYETDTGWWIWSPWILCPCRRRRPLSRPRSSPSSLSTNQHQRRRKSGRHGAVVTSSSNGIVGARSRSYSTGLRTLGAVSPADASSPLSWLADEDIEAGNALAGDGETSRTPSVFKEGRPFGAPTTATTTATESAFRTSMGASPSRLSTRSSLALSSSLTLSSAESSPLSHLLARADLATNPQHKRPPPVPWAPWRRLSEPAIAPSLSSPPGGWAVATQDLSQAQHFYGDEKAMEAMEAGVTEMRMPGVESTGAGNGLLHCGAGREIAPSSSQDSAMLFMPPSPATPPSTGSSVPGTNGRVRGRRVASSEMSLSAVQKGQNSAAAGASGGGAKRVATADARGSPARNTVFTPRRNRPKVIPWGGFTEVGEAGETALKMEEDLYESCAEFAAATGFVAPSEGFVPSLRLLEVAMAKEKEEKKRADMARSLAELGSTGPSAVFSDVEDEEEEEEAEESGEGGEIWEDQKEKELESETDADVDAETRKHGREETRPSESAKVIQASKGDCAGGAGSPFSSSGGTERMESGLTCYSSGGGSERGDAEKSSKGATVATTTAVMATASEVPRSPNAQVTGLPISAAAVPEYSTGARTEAPPPGHGAGGASQLPQFKISMCEKTMADEAALSRLQLPPLPPVQPPLTSPPESPVSSPILSPSALPPTGAAFASGLPVENPGPPPPPARLPPPPRCSREAVATSDRSSPAPRALSVSCKKGEVRARSSCRADRLPSHSTATAAGASIATSPTLCESTPSGRAALRCPPLERDHPPPKTPPPSSARLERRAPPRMAARDRAVVVAAARAKSQAARAAQTSTASQAARESVPAPSQPARAQPARAAPSEETMVEGQPPSPFPDAASVQPAQLSYASPIAPAPMAHSLRNTPSPPSKTPPPPLPLLPLNLFAVGIQSHITYAPPSPSGWSNSGSPSSARSSPVFMRAPQQQATGLPPAFRSGRDGGAASYGLVCAPMAWSWSDSTLSGCSRSGGRGGGMSSVSASVCSDYPSPLVGMRFVDAGDAPDDGGSRGRARSRPTSGSGVRGVSELPLMGVRGSPPLLAVARSGEEEGIMAASSNAAVSGEEGRSLDWIQAKRRKRFFFP